MTPKRILSRAEFARAAGVSRAAVTKWLSGPGAAAAHSDGALEGVDLDAPAAAAFLAKHKARGARRKGEARSDGAAPSTTVSLQLAAAAPPASPKPGRRSASAPTTPAPAEPGPVKPSPKRGALAPALDEAGYSDELGELTLREIVSRFGTVPQYETLLGAYAKKEQARKTRLDNEKTEGSLISRELVKAHVFGAIDGAFKRLLGDTAKTIALRLGPHIKAGGNTEDAEKIARELIASQLKPLKKTAVRVLQNA